MKKIIYILLVFPVIVMSQSNDQNWVKSKIYKVPTDTILPTATAVEAITQVNYYDGLGRPIQQVAYAQSNSGKDIVTHIEYDAFGRVEKEFLPFVASGTASLNIKTNEVASFYGSNNASLTGNPNSETTQFPFSEKQFEASPFNRVLKQAAPGDPWHLGSGKEIKFDYQTNLANEVKKYKATATWDTTKGLYEIILNEDGHYALNELYKTITYDENSPGGLSKIGRTEEFKNKEGQIILKRTFADVFENGSLVESDSKHDTFYVYDKFGNLTYVVPPLVTNVISQLNDLCYQYKYDYKNRLVEKKLPGKQWEYIVYDKLDRVVATGPAYNPYGASSETQKGWLISRYDIFNRPVYTAWYNAAVANTADRKALQIFYDSIEDTYSESKTTNVNIIDGIPTKYTNQTGSNVFLLLTINYYDNYDYPNAPVVPSTLPDSTLPIATTVKGLPTGTWVRVLDVVNSTSNELSYTIYDTKFRPVRSYTKNYLGGFTQVDSKLDWSGKTEYTATTHKRTTSEQLYNIKERFTYSAQDRLVKHTHEIVGFLPEELLTLNTYDELGQLISKKVGGKASGSAVLQNIDYSYNIRGWLKTINNIDNLTPSTTENDLFAFKINYNSPETATPLFNGNISETFWKTDADNVKRKYAYKYDNLNRLLEANYNKPLVSGTLDNYLEKLSYDKAGNILTLERNGNLDPSGGNLVNPIDKLVYTYHTDKKNELIKVNDLSSSPQGFNQNNDIASGDVDENNEDYTNDYTYDLNGNMLTDTNKGIKEITYNHLNLPVFIKFQGTTNGTISYIYNAVGQKVKKVVYDDEAHTVTTTDYLSGFQYKNAVLQFFPHAEGYVHYTRPLTAQGGQNSALGNFNYVFNYTDHLGNVRVSFAKDPVDNNVVKILEENHYYAFGMKHQNYNVEHLDFDHFPETGVEIVPAPAVANATYNYKFQGQERQEELGLNWDSYKYRNYDMAIGRFMSIDPLSEEYAYQSHYNFAENKVISYRELEGLEGVWFQAVMNADKAANPNGVSAHVMGFTQGLANSAKGLYNAVTSPVQTAKGITNIAVAGAARNNPALMAAADAKLGTSSLKTSIAVGKSIDKGINNVVNGNGTQRGEVIGEIAGAVIGAKGVSAGIKGASAAGIANPVPNMLARVIPANVEATTLGASSAESVFVTGASDISGLNAAQIANKLTIPLSPSGFKVIEFPTPSVGLSTPFQSTSPGFIGGGRTLGGAREFTIPNQPIPTGTGTSIKTVN